MFPEQAIYQAAVALAEKKRQGCRVCMGYPDGPCPAAEHPLKPSKKRAAAVPDHHIAAHIKLARGDVNTVAPILWAALSSDGSGSQVSSNLNDGDG